MNLDITTLALVEPVILMVGVFILWFQFHLAKSFVYVKFWMTGTTLMACGVFFMPLVKVPTLLFLAVISNPLYVMGLLVIYQGTALFLQKRYRIRLIVLIYCTFLIPYFFFIFRNNNVWMRNLIVNSTYCIIFLLIAGVILKNRKQPKAVSFLFTAGIFSLAAVFSLLCIILSLNKPFDIDYLGLGISLPLSFLIFAILSILWTFGFILIHQDVINNAALKPNDAISKGLSSEKNSLEQQNPYNLSERELEILFFLNQGLTYEEIAKSCFISKNTVKTHIKNIYSKYNVSSRINLLLKLKEENIPLI
ncbi:MAG: hypothetical protein JEZ04_16845 [Spirochaetales bacterium]|nr:hypothetical protein [Spirochaetales bacterium]